MSLKTLSAAALAGLMILSALAQPAWAGTPRLAIAGTKDDDTVVLLDMASRRNVNGKIEADVLLIFPLTAPSFMVRPATGDGRPPRDHGRITLQFDCKGRTIDVVRMTLLAVDDAVIAATEPPSDPQTPVDPTDAHMLAYACGEAFPDTAKTFASEKAAIEAVRAMAPS
jgi:hypothetical protein